DRRDAADHRVGEEQVESLDHRRIGRADPAGDEVAGELADAQGLVGVGGEGEVGGGVDGGHGNPSRMKKLAEPPVRRMTGVKRSESILRLTPAGVRALPRPISGPGPIWTADREPGPSASYQ